MESTNSTPSTDCKQPNELRVDPSDGNPYTRLSFMETYENGEELWEKASVWGANSVLQIRTCGLAQPAPAPPHSILGNQSSSRQPYVHAPEDFPEVLSDLSKRETSVNGTFHYSQAVTKSPGTNYVPSQTSLNVDAQEWPGSEAHQEKATTTVKYNYSTDTPSTNDEFSKLAADLWDGSEFFPQPPEDIVSLNIDWRTAIHGWGHEQWREFGIKYFYGYVQQSSLLLDHLSKDCEEAPLGSWGDE